MDFKFKDHYKMYINGQWCDSEKGTTAETYNPATGALNATFPDATEKDVDKAVKAAQEAFKTWSKTNVYKRSEILNKIADLLEENRMLLATAETLDSGKPIRESFNGDLYDCIEHFRYFAGVILAEEGSSTILKDRFLSVVLREPIGVVGQIVPWNFPLSMAAWKLAPAIAAGNCSVIKPSKETTLSLLVMMEVIGDVVPKGVINVVTGKGSKSGEYLKHHPGIRKLAFTGSTEIGRGIGIAAAERIIPSTLELGGKSANIIFDDADFEKALEGVQVGILWNQGQVCSAGSRVFIQEGIYDKLVEKLVEKFKAIKVGNPMDPNTVMGAQINKSQYEIVANYIDIGLKEGATLACGGHRITTPPLDKGYFFEPTILTNVTNDMRVAQEEIFGPVIVVIKFKDEEEVVKMANDSEFGLAGGVFTENINRAINVARAMETGRVYINTYNQNPAGIPFGGYKNSGIGRETHKMILDHYSLLKAIMIDLSKEPLGAYDCKA